MNSSLLSPMSEAIDAFAAGRMVIIVDDEDRENEGDLVIAADFATPGAVNFMVTHGRGLVCLAMRGELIDRLQIPMMVPSARNRSGFGTGFTVSVEAVQGVSTGISAADRAATIATLIDPASKPCDIASPGHMFPLRARDGGVLERRGQTEASVDLAMLAGLTPAGVICEVMREDGDMMRLGELAVFAREHAIPIISVEQIAAWRLSNEVGRQPVEVGRDTACVVLEAPVVTSIEPVVETPSDLPAIVEIARSRLPTVHGEFELVVFRDAQGLEHSALLAGERGARDDGSTLVRLHSECLTGDTFGSMRCDCGEQLEAALRESMACGDGIVLYLRQEGRGIGLGNKIAAYALQDEGLDTVDANEALGFPPDARHYGVAAAMLEALGARRVLVLGNNPAKARALAGFGMDVAGVRPLVIGANEHNRDYLATKARRMGHRIPIDSAVEPDRHLPDRLAV